MFRIHTIGIVSAASLLALSVAHADDTTVTQSTTGAMTEQPAEAAPLPLSDNSTTLPATADSEPAPDLSAPPATSPGSVISANEVIGQAVYDTAGNNIGEVNDLILSKAGEVETTVVGVGGFLGIGEKDVAVPMTAINIVSDGQSIKLIASLSKEQLEVAPAYQAQVRQDMSSN